MTPRTTKRQRLETAGYRHVSGWVSIADADEVAAMVEYHAEDVQRIGETLKKSGRPRKNPLVES